MLFPSSVTCLSMSLNSEILTLTCSVLSLSRTVTELSLEEKLLQALEIPYQVVKMCSGDLGAPAARKYDLEAWIPTQEKYRELTSTSTTTDFQSRRLHIKYRDGKMVDYVHMLNGTAFSMGRPIVAILENFQEKDGSVRIPKVLQKWMGKDRIYRP